MMSLAPPAGFVGLSVTILEESHVPDPELFSQFEANRYAMIPATDCSTTLGGLGWALSPGPRSFQAPSLPCLHSYPG